MHSLTSLCKPSFLLFSLHFLISILLPSPQLRRVCRCSINQDYVWSLKKIGELANSNGLGGFLP